MHNIEFKADDIYIGDYPADAVYLGEDLIFLRNSDTYSLMLEMLDGVQSIHYTLNGESVDDTFDGNIYTAVIFDDLGDISNIFADNQDITKVLMMPKKGVTNDRGMFAGCSNLVYANMSGYEFKSNNHFAYCDNLVTVEGPFKLPKIAQIIHAPKLSYASAMEFINATPQLSGGFSMQLNFSKEVFDKLREEDIAIATSRGWTVTSIV